ncbi:hypothetical protein [Bifidobacterium callitrichos]|uniref:hypothetical protein n=1 Tax=Bifidobacterium callitrichos TaxID=762209 RepID=UPI0021591EC4|nr:hypothetical protein [Bifidobacterium callitrichos]
MKQTDHRTPYVPCRCATHAHPYGAAARQGTPFDRSGIAFDVDLWRRVFRVLKPGAYCLAFGATRTVHRLACAIEDAGFEIRRQIDWIRADAMPHGTDAAVAA